MSDISVIESKVLSKPYDRRYVVVDKTTGEVLDDAQGYGYKTIRNAYAAYGYKTRDKSKDKAKATKERYIRRWMREHEDFVDLMDTFAFEIAKGSWGPDEKFDAAFVKRMLADNHLEADFTPGEILKVWRKR